MPIKMPQHVEDKLFEKFSMFLDQFQKYDYYKYWSYLDYVNYYFIIARFAYNFMVTEKIEAIMHAYFCHVGIDLIFCTIAEEIGIKTLFFHPEYEIETGRFLSLYSTSMDFDKIYSSMTKKRRDCNLTVKKSFKRDLTYMKNIKYYGLKNLKFKLSIFFKMIIYMFLPESNRKKTKYVNKIERLLQDRACIKKRDFIIKPVDYNKKYVYFGLHLQPEATTSFFGENILTNYWR